MTKLSPTEQKFIVHWGEMGERWGINRTTAQIHALVYISPEPLNAEEISKALSIARSTVSAGLRELLNWGIIKVAQVLGDRTDHFEAISDVWEMFRIIVDIRKRRELDPTLHMLQEMVVALDEQGGSPSEPSRRKILEMLDLLETASTLYEQSKGIPTRTIVGYAKKGGILRRVLNLLSEG